MKVYCVIIFFLIAQCTWADESAIKHSDDDRPFQGTRNVLFDWNLTKRVFASHKSNVVISPLSVKILLVLLYEATGDAAELSVTQTKIELQSVLEPNGDLNTTRNLYRQWLDSALSTNKEYDLQIATKFFVEEYIDVINKYQVISDHYYSATVDKIPFSQPKVAADLINSWVSNTTHGRIQELVTADGVDGAVITLINAIYFKGLWTNPFPENGPTLTFYGRQKQVQTKFMEQNGQFYYDDSSTLDAQLLRMSYRGSKFAMYILLPHQGKTVDDVLEKITGTSLHRALWYMDETEVNVTIPKFKFDFSEELNQPLKDLGLREIFSPNASLPLLARGKGTRNEVRVSRVFQKAGININEKGSEAYAATEIQLVNKFGGDGTQIFNANRPFLFFIEDEDFGTLLFAGKVEDPTK